MLLNHNVAEIDLLITSELLLQGGLHCVCDVTIAVKGYSAKLTFTNVALCVVDN